MLPALYHAESSLPLCRLSVVFEVSLQYSGLVADSSWPAMREMS